ncbi:MAG: methyltransferase [Desulfovermiculus sp.]
MRKETSPSEIETARANFPAGLIQPQKGFRFGLDSLVLACFVSCRAGDRILDLGTGCGVVGLGLGLMHLNTSVQILGLEVQTEMVRAAQENAYNLGLDTMYRVRQGDVREHRTHPDIGAESFDQVVCNPPYRHLHQGRQPQDPGKRRACFQESAGLGDFVQTASYALTNKGRMVLVQLAENTSILLSSLQARRLEPKEMRLVHPSRHAPAHLVLVRALKNARPGLRVLPPLIVDNILEMGSFCPLLDKGAGGGSGSDG